MDPDAMEDVFGLLHHKMQEWEDMGIGLPGAFRLSMRKGQFCFDKTGRAFNACRAAASGQQVQDYCKKYKLPLEKTYATALYTEVGAILFARTWANKMLHWYQIYLDQGDPAYRFTQDDVDSFSEPAEFATQADDWLHSKKTSTQVLEFRNLRPRS